MLPAYSFKSVESEKDGKTYLEISGLCGHSALAIERIVKEEKNGEIHLYALLTLAKSNKRSGALEYQLFVPPETNKVYFGRKERLIWERKPSDARSSLRNMKRPLPAELERLFVRVKIGELIFNRDE